MDEQVVAQVDADVAVGPPHGVEKDQVAWLEFGGVNRVSGTGLLGCTAGQQQPQRVCVHGLNESAAIKTGVRGAAPAVGRAQMRHGNLNDVSGLIDEFAGGARHCIDAL